MNCQKSCSGNKVFSYALVFYVVVNGTTPVLGNMRYGVWKFQILHSFWELKSLIWNCKNKTSNINEKSVFIPRYKFLETSGFNSCTDRPVVSD